MTFDFSSHTSRLMAVLFCSILAMQLVFSIQNKLNSQSKKDGISIVESSESESDTTEKDIETEKEFEKEVEMDKIAFSCSQIEIIHQYNIFNSKINKVLLLYFSSGFAELPSSPPEQHKI